MKKKYSAPVMKLKKLGQTTLLSGSLTQSITRVKTTEENVFMDVSAKSQSIYGGTESRSTSLWDD